MKSKKMFLLMMVVLFVVGFCACESAFAEWWEWPKLIADDTAAGDRYGYSVSIYENKAIVGAVWDDDEGDASGAAYIFEKDGSSWTQVAKLVPSDIGPGDMFGISVCIRRSRAIVGSYSLDGHTGGVAYIFEDDGLGWTQVARLRPNGVEREDGFGKSVAISGEMVNVNPVDDEYAIVGAPYDDSKGSVYIFRRSDTGWSTYGTKKQPSDGAVGDNFGYSVGIWYSHMSKDSWAVIGAPSDDDNGENSGSAYFYKRSFMIGVWGLDEKITPSDCASGDLFGSSIGTFEWDLYAAIGAPGDDDVGSAYVFDSTGSSWVQNTKLTPSDGASSDGFGKSVSIGYHYSGGYYVRVLVGSPYDDNKGSAYVFDDTSSGWTQTDKLTPSDGASSDAFGRSVSLGQNTALIGALFDDNFGLYSGSAYIFSTSLGTSIRGTKWHDFDKDGVRDQGEPGLEGWRIYVDANENGQWDEGERAGITNEDGDYFISNISPCSYVVREELQAGWVQTFPDGSGVHVVNVEAGLVNSGVNFGNCSAYIFVDAHATGANNGRSWTHAYKYLQDALANAVSGNEIFVAEGTYKPDQKRGQTPGVRKATFKLINGVAIKGGYGGFGEPGRNVRDIDAYKTILSGDLDENDDGFTNNGENSYHVVTGSGTDTTAVLDGFTITAGNANGSGKDMKGGGMINQPNGNPRITNCTFRGNSAAYGGAIHNFDHSSPTLINCYFKGNSASRGGGMHNGYYSTTTLTNCTFSGNSANYGGGMLNHLGSDATVINCTFSGNSAGSSGGGMYNYNNSPTLTNCILWSNSAGISGDEIYNNGSTSTISSSDIEDCGGSGRLWDSALGTDGGGNIDADPMFVSASNLHLQVSSPCIDAGDNRAVPSAIKIDLDGHPRIVDGDGNFTDLVDMGAYEFVGLRWRLRRRLQR